MAEIKTLHLVPREGMQVSEKPSVVRVRFGDGYEQRRPPGLNAAEDEAVGVGDG
ncbi:tail protein [Escherichia coli]|nr:tail protein [Escherichia coli]